MPPDNPFLAVDRQIVGDVYTTSEAMDNLTVLCDEFGSRFAGTEGERQAAEFMKSKLEEYGLSNVHAEPVEYTGWRRGQVQFEIISPVQRPISCITLPHSPPANLRGVVIDMGDGAPDDFEERADEIKGKIVLTNSNVRPKDSDRWIHRNEKLGHSLMAGATGFIFVNHYPGYGPATGGIGHDGRPSLIPGVAVSKEDGAYMQRLIERKGEVRVRLTSSDQIEPMVSWNVVGELLGQKEPERVVILGCHYDGHDISQGAADPASGTVAVMEAARVLAKYADELPYTVRFVLWGVEEIGLLGSADYVRQHQAELDNVRFYLNMDMAGAIEHKGIVLNEWPALEQLFQAWRREMALEFGIEQSVSAHSDHYPFLKAGVPTGAIGRVGPKAGGRGYGHTMYDTLDKVNLKGLREASVLAARLALRLASEQEWPVARRSQDEVDALFDDPDYREEAEFWARLDAFYQEAQNQA